MCSWLRPSVLTVAFLVIFGRGAGAQGVTTGNVFAGAGVFKCCLGQAGAWQIGGGAEVPIAGGVSVVGDFGLSGPTGDGIVLVPSGYVSFGTASLISVGGSYHFADTQNARQPRPFLTGGIGMRFGQDGAEGGINLGGGIDCWLKERRGVRLEVRDQLLGSTHMITARVGLLFR
jgi:hypothetical protein